MEISLTIWLVTVGAIIGFILLDLFTVSAKPHEVKFKEAASWSIFYIALAILFGIWIWNEFGNQNCTKNNESESKSC